MFTECVRNSNSALGSTQTPPHRLRLRAWACGPRPGASSFQHSRNAQLSTQRNSHHAYALRCPWLRPKSNSKSRQQSKSLVASRRVNGPGSALAPRCTVRCDVVSGDGVPSMTVICASKTRARRALFWSDHGCQLSRGMLLVLAPAQLHTSTRPSSILGRALPIT